MICCKLEDCFKSLKPNSLFIFFYFQVSATIITGSSEASAITVSISELFQKKTAKNLSKSWPADLDKNEMIRIFSNAVEHNR